MNDYEIATRKTDLQKFSRYELKLDIYNFQSEFTKIYKKETPKRMIADISLVLQVIDWKQHMRILSYFSRGLKPEFSGRNKLWKLKNPDKLVQVLSRIIKTMRYLQNLALEHRIEVVNGDIEITYQLPEANRVTRCLTTMWEK